MVRCSNRPEQTGFGTSVRATCAVAVAAIVLLTSSGAAQAARQVTLTAVADSGLYNDNADGRCNRGAAGRFDVGPLQGALLKFNLDGVLGSQEAIQTAVLQLREAKGDGTSFSMHVVAYPLTAAWQEGVGTTGGVIGSIGAPPWGPVSMGDVVYRYKQVTQPGPGNQVPALAGTAWDATIVAVDGIAWGVAGGKGIGTDVVDRQMIDQDWVRSQGTIPQGGSQPAISLTPQGVTVLNDWAKGPLTNYGMNLWVTSYTNSNSARCAARELGYPSQLILTIVSITSITDLTASNPQWDRVTLSWTTPPATPGTGYPPASYDIRYSTAAITDANWASATPIAGAPTPGAPGSPQTFVVTGLSELTTYYFAVKSTDTGGQVSALSNVPSAATPMHDVYSPSAVTDLAVGNVLPTQVSLHWSATGDDNLAGRATRYEVRYSTAALTDANFATATLVSQSLVPQLPMYLETLTVTGLSANTTYYFALKAYDDVNNASPLSNIAAATTPAVDTTAPGSITDLAASGSDAMSVNLTWTAPGDNGGTGQAAAYDIRYSTAAINDANWASATRAPNPVPPQAAGSTEHFSLIGLLPGTPYHFAIKTSDKQGNTSALSNVAARTTGSLPVLPLVTSMQIVEKAGVTTANYPVTLSMGFVKGDVTGNVTVRAAGQVLPTQTDVKVTWPDGSVRHALVSFVIPQLQANQSQTVEILAGGPNYNTGWLTKDQLLSCDFEALLSIVTSTRTDVSARQLLQGIASPEYWIKGGVCSEFIIRDWSQRVFGQLNVSYRVRVYPTAGAIRVSTVVDNTWIDARGNIDYSCALTLGKNSPQTVYTKTNLTHFHDARWHKVFWQGQAPSKIETRYNLPYWIKGGFLPSYDTSLVVPSATISGEYANWSGSAHDIMDGAGLTKYMPTTGGRSEIAPYPQWASLYLCSMDYRLAEVTINYGDLSGSIPFHFRESDPARSFYRRPFSVDDRPTIWTTQVDVAAIQGNIAPADRFPAAIGDLTTPWTIETAHMGSLSYIPYLITGDLYHLEELQFWATYALGGSNAGYRGAAQCWLIDQIRGNAWSLRSVVDAAVMTPDGMPEKAYLNAKININITRWNSMFIHSEGPSIRSYGAGSYTGDSSIDAANCSYASGIWQDDYFTWAFIHAYQMGYPTLDMVHWGSKGVIDRFTNWPGWNRFRGAPYAMPAMGKDAGGNAIQYATWADVNNGFTDKVGPANFGGAAGNPNSYEFAARGVIGLAANQGNGPAVWSWISTQLPASTYASDPRWAFVPPQVLVGDIDNSGHVNVVDLLYMADSWSKTFGNAGYNVNCDLSGDNTVDAVDLLSLASHWGQ